MGYPGFGGEFKDVLREHADFLTEWGRAKPRWQCFVFERNLLRRYVDANRQKARRILRPIPAWSAGHGVTDTRRHSIMLTGGRCAMPDDGMGFSISQRKPRNWGSRFVG